MDSPSGINWQRLGERIHTARRRKGWTSAQLAQQAGTVRATISLLENGRKPHISFDVIIRIADALELSLDVLTGRKRDEEFDCEAVAVA